MTASNTTEKKYPVVSPDGASKGVLVSRPDEPAHGKQTFACLTLMLAHSSARDSLRDGEIQLLHHAIKKNNITTDEAMEAFWKAYGDPYVSQGRIEFRHLWKYIEERRGEKDKQFTYQEMLREIDKTGMPMDAFEIMNGEGDSPLLLDSIGKPKWRYRK